MKNYNIFMPLALAIPLAFAAGEKSPAFPNPVPCNTQGTQGFTVTLSVDDDGSGNPVISFTNYTLVVGPGGGKAKSPLIFVCLGGQATFKNASNKDRIKFKNDPNGVFSESPRNNPNPTRMYIIHNTNAEKNMFRYSVTVQTIDFGEMVIDPRVENGGGGNP